MRFAAQFLFLIFLIWATAAHAENALNYSAFRMLPILHEGRVKPLDSYARLKLEQFSGQETGADAWLAETLFDPAQAAQKPIFASPSNNDVRKLLNLTEQDHYTLAEVQTALARINLSDLLEAPSENLAAEQKEILQLAENALDYNRMLRSFSLILPLDIGEGRNYLQLSDPALQAKLQKLIKRKGINPERYTEKEKRLAELAFGLQQIRKNGEGSDEFKVIPVTESLKDERLSPWQSLNNKKSPALKNWENMARAYRNNDSAAWENITRKTLDESGYAPIRTTLEIFYNMLKPFHLALALYVLSALLFLPLGKKLGADLKSFAFPALFAALTLHAFGLICRILILGRPPVGTLYEAVLFVSFICAATGLIKRTPATLLSGLAAAITLLLLAPAVLPKGENMEMLVAVLNTNFWLATHVLCITGGYAVSILTACLAHIYLAAAALHKNAKTLKMLQQNIYVFSITALLLTAVGTALGGIWADQSWGRFWGWDPKENGALLIVLWLAWLQHGRLGNKLKPLDFAAGAAFLNIIVALAWFGVNLLNVGLHSYGFTSGLAAGLMLFCSLEIVIIGALRFYSRKGT
jgi:ABC-type transport system involved in cytochrome c biogenesis permease subunit